MTENKKARRFRPAKILNIIKNAILISLAALFILAAGVVSFKRIVYKDPAPSFLGYSFLIIVSPSMTDAVNVGDIVIMKSADSYDVGDIVTYVPAAENISVTHRIVRREGDKFFTKGDANNAEDMDPVYIDNIRGKLLLCIPKLGVLFGWLKTPTGLFFLAAITATVVGLVCVLKNLRREKEKAEDDGENEENLS